MPDNARRTLLSESDVDLVLVLAVSATAMILMFAPLVSGTIVRGVIATLFLLFVPGYSFAAALFPGRDDMDGLTRFALSLGISVAFIPIVGLGLNGSPWGVSLESLALCTALITGACVLIAHRRRDTLPEEKRFVVKVATVVFREKLFPASESSFDRKLTAVVIIVALISVPSVAYFITSTKPAETYTELYISPVDGTIGGYPTDFQLGQQKAVTAVVANHEGHNTAYNLVTVFDNGTKNQTLDSEQIILANGQVWKKDISLKPDQAGKHMKIAFVLYRQDSAATPYREVYLWVNVTKPA